MLKIHYFEFLPVCCLQILMMNKDINPAELDFLLRYPVQPGVTSPVDFLSNHSWGGIKVQNERTHNFVALKDCCSFVFVIKICFAIRRHFKFKTFPQGLIVYSRILLLYLLSSVIVIRMLSKVVLPLGD